MRRRTATEKSTVVFSSHVIRWIETYVKNILSELRAGSWSVHVSRVLVLFRCIIHLIARCIRYSMVLLQVCETRTSETDRCITSAQNTQTTDCNNGWAVRSACCTNTISAWGTGKGMAQEGRGRRARDPLKGLTRNITNTPDGVSPRGVRTPSPSAVQPSTVSGVNSQTHH